MNSNDANFIERCLRQYYYEYFGIIDVPSKLSRHEFGYKKINSNITRHIQLQNVGELRTELMRELPLDVFLSSARYLSPASPMADKEWQYADLIFDIDAKDLNLECRPSHTVSVCVKCGRSDNKRCPCATPQVNQVSLTCDNCINASKNEVKKLLDILHNDIGVEKSQTRIYFSGNEGFHVHVSGSKFSSLKSLERSELIDYIMFRDIRPETLGMKKSGPAQLPQLDDAGWPGRFARHVFGSKSARPKIAKKITSDGYKKFADTLKTLSNPLGARIDPGVTTDIHRIFRMPGTINGKSGMTKILCEDLTKFNPYTDAVLIRDEKVTIRASCPTAFKLKRQKFGPYDNQCVSVPAYAAVYMICKGLGHITPNDTDTDADKT